jgi:peptidoglycan/xylan/chitin deacetylase (PgdA/CDA1 family)
LKRKKKKKYTNVLWAAGTGAVFIIFLYAAHAAFQRSEAAEALSALPPELESASAIEASLQSLSETGKVPGAIKVPIFVYHSVRPHIPNEAADQETYDVTPQLLEQQLQYLKKNGYTVISLDQLAADLTAGTTSPVQKPVILTFDDGWENQYIYAFPLLKKYNVTATFYIYTNPIGTKHFMTWDEVKTMDAAGMTIGDHSLSHPYFKGLALSQGTIEVTESKVIIESHLGKPVLHFASPFGYTDADIMAIVKAAGYETGRTTYKGAYQDNPFMVRGFLSSDSFDEFVKDLQ